MARAMPVISMSRPRKTNSGTASRMRWLMPSSMRADQDHQRRVRRQRQIAENRKAERKGDRHAGEHRAATTPTKKIRRFQIAELPEQRPAKPEQRDDDGNGAERREARLAAIQPRQPQQRERRPSARCRPAMAAARQAS